MTTVSSFNAASTVNSASTVNVAGNWGTASKLGAGSTPETANWATAHRVSVTQAVESQIVKKLLAQPLPHTGLSGLGQGRWVERMIGIVAATAGMFALGAVLQELLWAMIGAASIVALGAPGKAK